MTRDQAYVELEKIRVQSPDLRLHARAIVNVVRADRQHPLREFFTEDINEAAMKRWIDEARHLIRWVRVRVVFEATKPRMPAYYSLHCDRDKGGGYRPTAVITQNEDLLQSLKETALEELQGWVRRYQHIKLHIHDDALRILGISEPIKEMPELCVGD